MSFDPTKPVQTRDGKPARIIVTDRKLYGGLWISALIYDGVNETLMNYRKDGQIQELHLSPYDLVNKTKKITKWVNILQYKDIEKNQYKPYMGSGLFETKEEAIEYGKTLTVRVLDTVSITYEIPDDS